MDNSKLPSNFDMDPDQLKLYIGKIRRKIARKTRKLEYSEQVAKEKRNNLDNQQDLHSGSQTSIKDFSHGPNPNAFHEDANNLDLVFEDRKNKCDKLVQLNSLTSNESIWNCSFFDNILDDGDEHQRNSSKSGFSDITQQKNLELGNSFNENDSLQRKMFPRFPFDKITLVPSNFVLPNEYNALKLHLIQKCDNKLTTKITNNSYWNEKQSLNLTSSKKRLIKSMESDSTGADDRSFQTDESVRSDSNKNRRKKCKFKTDEAPLTKSPFFVTGSMTSCLQGVLDSPVLAVHLTTISYQGTMSTIAIVCQSKLATIWIESCSKSWKIWYEWEFKRVKPTQFYFLKNDNCITTVVISTPKTGPLATVLVCTKDKITKTFTTKFSTSNLWWRKCIACIGCTHSNNQELVLAGTMKTQTPVLVNCSLSLKMDDFDLKYLSPVNEMIEAVTPVNKMANTILGQAENTYYIWDTETGILLETYKVNISLDRALWSACEQGIIFAIIIPKNISSLYQLIGTYKGNTKTLRSYTRENGFHICSHSTRCYFLALDSSFTICIWNIHTGQLVARLKSALKMTVLHPFETVSNSNQHMLAIGFENGCTHIYQ